MNDLESKIEAILFWKGESVSLKKLGEYLKVSPGEIIDAITQLKVSLHTRGIVLVENGDEYMLGTAKEHSELIEMIQKEELNKELTKSSLETLSIILYKNGASRSEIDYIRGVNSSFTLRALSIRGLVERITDEKDSRKYIYKPTFELLSYMGVTSVAELPDYEEVNKSVAQAADNLQKELDNESGTTQ